MADRRVIIIVEDSTSPESDATAEHLSREITISSPATAADKFHVVEAALDLLKHEST